MMSSKVFRTSALSVAALMLMLGGVALGLLANNALASGSAVIYACKGNHSGTLRLVDAGADCPRGQALISWNVEGPAGLQGVPGEQGPAGAVGEPGVAGAAGISNYTVVEPLSNISPLAPGATLSIGRSCPDGLSMLSGGIDGPNALNVRTSIPGPGGTSWQFFVENTGAEAIPADAIQFRLICATVAS